MPTDGDSDPATVYLTDVDVAIIGDVIGHPYELPTLSELIYMQSEDAARIEDRVETLCDRDVLEKVTHESPTADEHPETFIGVTEFGKTTFTRRIPESFVSTLKTAYAEVEKPDRIKTLERAPRPPR